MDEAEYELTGGNVADRVVRVGSTVRKPSTHATDSVESFLEHLHAVGYAGAPRSLGRDELGRHMLEYIPGSTVDMAKPLSSLELSRLGRMIRELHVAAQSFVPPAWANWNVAIPPDDPLIICHNDLAPWNLVRDGDRWVFIDWDGSGPASPLWDLAYAAQSFLPLAQGGNPEHDADRLRAFVDGYGLDQSNRSRLPKVLVDRTRAMYELLRRGAASGQQPWARLYEEGHGRYSRQAAAYIQKHMRVLEQALASDPG